MKYKHTLLKHISCQLSFESNFRFSLSTLLSFRIDIYQNQSQSARKVLKGRSTTDKSGDHFEILIHAFRICRSMLKRLDTRYCCVVLIVLTLFVILFFDTNVLPSTDSLVSKNMIAEDVSSYTTLPQRKSLLIVGQGRSGTSFVSKMLAIGERVSKNNV